jgi:hypothetical protein
LLLDILVQEYTLWSIFPAKKFREETWPKIYLGRDPDPDVFKSRIRSKIVLMIYNMNKIKRENILKEFY